MKAALVGAALIGAALLGATTISSPPEVPPCLSEDAPGPCYWDAQTRGNGLGRSFTVTSTGEVIYK